MVEAVYFHISIMEWNTANAKVVIQMHGVAPHITMIQMKSGATVTSAVLRQVIKFISNVFLLE